MVAITVIALAVVIFRYRNASNQRRAAEAQAALGRARTVLTQLQSILLLPSADPEQIAIRREQLNAETLAELGEVLADSDDNNAVLRAEAYATRGDLFWTMGNAPVYPQATTRPALATKEPAESLLKDAAADYQKVIADYPNQKIAWVTAEFGLAAIAENQHDWDAAAKRYHEV
ncbi:MAG: hypothetical protein JO353_05785, partial [Phycisphaerae bacterium]|nr:hypothetical protein [Phycisphaerae bacterium]